MAPRPLKFPRGVPSRHPCSCTAPPPGSCTITTSATSKNTAGRWCSLMKSMKRESHNRNATHRIAPLMSPIITPLMIPPRYSGATHPYSGATHRPNLELFCHLGHADSHVVVKHGTHSCFWRPLEQHTFAQCESVQLVPVSICTVPISPARPCVSNIC